MAIALGDLDLLLHTIKNCVCEALDAARIDYPDYPGCPCFNCVVTGSPTWDHCGDEMIQHENGECSCGQLTVSTVRLYPYSTFGDTGTGFPIQQTDIIGIKQGCVPSGLAADINVTLLRCSAAPQENETTVPCEILERQSWINSIDLMVLLNSVVCCLENGDVPNKKNRRYLLQQANPLDSEGMCEGSELLLTVDLGVPCPCPDHTSP